MPNPVMETGGPGAVDVDGGGEVVDDEMVAVVLLAGGLRVTSEGDEDDPWKATARPVTAAMTVATVPT